METPAIIALIYIAIGAAIFSFPPIPATPDDFHWRRQMTVFRANFRDVLIWPLALWQWLAVRR
ncbi:MAG TPA: hypothetical protein VMB84_13215 [Stellaceae bacterium]|nr:hypothetical protein [Stellaceae bacterium]